MAELLIRNVGGFKPVSKLPALSPAGESTRPLLPNDKLGRRSGKHRNSQPIIIRNFNIDYHRKTLIRVQGLHRLNER